ncbi:hypothetical protein [Haloterrigena gelatinilytica]|nr:hypothetical protein [Haloterrigena gelatinilytica]
MTHQSDQRQHDRTGEQYGQRPEARGPGTRTGTGMDTQPQFGGSSEQSETGGQETSTTRDRGPSTSRSTTDQQEDPRQQAGRPIADRGSEPMRGRQRGGQRMSGHRDGQRTNSHRMGRQRLPQTGTQGTRRTETRGTPQASPTRGMQQRGGGQTTQAPFFEDHMTDELWIALEDFSELSHVAAWCATRCASGGPELGRCARICQDLAEIAALNEMLIARDSMFGPELATAFLRVADEGLPTLRQFQDRHPHVLETVATIERTMNSCESLLRRVGGGSQGRQGTGTGAGSTGSRGMRGMAEQGEYGQGMSGQPRGGSEVTGQRY